MSHRPPKDRPRPHATTATLAVDGRKTGPWSQRPDEDLLAEYASKKTREAFEELVHRYERELYTYLRRYLGRAELAEDAFQATFLQVHLSCREFDPSRRLRPWLYRIATTRAIDLLRRNRRHAAVSLNADASGRGSDDGLTGQDLVDSRDAGPGEQLEAAEDRQKIGAAVEKFPARLKNVVVLVMFQGLKYQATADTLGIPLGSVKSRLHEAVSRLRRVFAVPAQVAVNHRRRPYRRAVQGTRP
jgi:RNA polymerase sigma-70 factor, ECF subfamily